MAEKSGHGAGPLAKLGKLSSFLFRGGLRIARLALVDVSASELMIEDAISAEDCGPTSKTMADISDASKNYDDYMRILHVLRGSLALSATKKWREVLKTLTIMEYLLIHGSESFLVEFRDLKNRIGDLTHFVFVDENLVDRGSAIQSKAKQVNRLLMDENYFREERRRSQTVKKSIHGFGSQSFKSYSSSDLCQRPAFEKCSSYPHTPKVEKTDQADIDRKDEASGNNPSSPSPHRSASWSTSTSPANSSSQMSNASTDWDSFDESPTWSECYKSSGSPIEGGWAPPIRDTSFTRKISVDLELSSTASSRREVVSKLPPPPPGGSKVGASAQRNSSIHRPTKSVPDLILM